MFYFFSKLFWLIVAPLHLATLLIVGGVAARVLGRGRLGWALVGLGSALLLVMCYPPLHAAAVRPLENRFPLPDVESLQPTGIVVLGGATEIGRAARDRSVATLNGAAERMTIAVQLARRFPDATLLFTGNGIAAKPDDAGETEIAARFFREQGIDDRRVLLEERSRNTHDNAVFSAELVQPREGEQWILVTSAYHMPRAVGVFRQVGWEVLPFPSDYRTASRSERPSAFIYQGLMYHGTELARIAAHEWIGLLAYRLTGRTGELFPGPDSATP